MKELVVKITEQNKSYPIYIANSDINSLKDSITDFLGEKDYVVVISKKTFFIALKILFVYLYTCYPECTFFAHF